MLTRGQKALRSQQQLDAIQALSGHVLELGPVATLLVLQLSVRQLWLLKRVNRYFRRMATAALMTMKRPVVGGGIPQEGGQQSIELLDLGSLRWSVKVLLPAARTDAAMTLMSDGTMMMAGGDISPESERASLRGWTVTNGVECYAPATQTWASMPRLNTERTSLRLVCCPKPGARRGGPSGDVRVLALGGCDDVENDTASVEGLDPCADAWIELAPMRTARHSFACACTTSGMVVAAGGQDRHGEDLQDAEVYDPLKNTWTPLPDVPDECRGATTGWELEGYPDIVVVCGLGEEDTTRRCAYAIDLSDPPNLQYWQLLWSADFEKRHLDTGAGAAGAVVPVRGGCLLIGGSSAQNDNPDDPRCAESLACGDLYDEETDRVYHLPHPMRYPRRWTFSFPGLHPTLDMAAAPTPPPRA